MMAMFINDFYSRVGIFVFHVNKEVDGKTKLSKN